jgi:hypothetical protein
MIVMVEMDEVEIGEMAGWKINCPDRKKLKDRGRQKLKDRGRKKGKG